MKIITVDNHGKDYVTERVVAENIQNEREAEIILDALRNRVSEFSDDWYELKPDDYQPYVFEGF